MSTCELPFDLKMSMASWLRLPLNLVPDASEAKMFDMFSFLNATMAWKDESSMEHVRRLLPFNAKVTVNRMSDSSNSVLKPAIVCSVC